VLENNLLVQGQPQTMDGLRKFFSTPRADLLATLPVGQNLQFLRFLVDPRKAEGQRLDFTLAAEGHPQIWRVELRNSVLVITNADSKGALHVKLTRSELADFVLGKGVPAKGGGPLAELDRVLDRSRLLPPTMPTPEVLDAKGDLKYNAGMQH
jgi:alkyl sulfatase BDS1-like metallo-beta-lactamase superfamily hydrolase